MRQLASFLLLGFAVAAGAADTWRWKDANGVVHYSDHPGPGAERVNVRAAPVPDATPDNPGPTSTRPAVPPPERVVYTSCVITTPANDEVFNAVNSVRASVMVVPGLAQGHRLQVLLNGAPYPNWPAAGSSFTFNDLYRGSYTLKVQVLDGGGVVLCDGPVSTFHVRQPSLLSPARQPVPARP